MSFSKIINHNQLLFNIFEPSINGKRIVKPRYNPPKSGSKSIVLGDYKHILEGKGYSEGKRRSPGRNKGNYARNNLESPVRRYYLCWELRGDHRYTDCIYRDTCTTLSYIQRKIFGGNENCYLSLLWIIKKAVSNCVSE